MKVNNKYTTFPQSATIACQGTQGAYSQFACEATFQKPNIMYFENFNAVFNAVDKGMCEYGILPIENSLHGSVSEILDLMSKYNFYIVRSAKLKINHSLLANHGVISPQIKEIYSHEQALAQCSEFIGNLKNIKIVEFSNTAAAARMVSESGRRDIAAIANPRCAQLYNLSAISGDIQNNANNYTKFICISKDLQVYDNANLISMAFSVAHKQGALYEFLSKFAERGINLTKIESRPIPGKDFEYMFYTEMEASINNPEIPTLISHLEEAPESFKFLGNYSQLTVDN
ncbi:MAG: prephenate dehydratase [Oscillospiraceae bacterium]|nr:prephenate dehydratase [Oscillospiraceae bacterium]